MAVNNALNTATTPIRPAFGGTGSSSIPSNGQIPIGNGTNYVAASITAGTGITVTPGSGSITIAAVATPGGLTWAGITGTTQAAAVDFGYIVQNASATTITLPATAPLGAIIAVQGLGAGGWVITANSGQTIQVGQTVTSSGGTVTSANAFDAIELIAVVADTTWAMRGPVSSGFTTA